MVDWRRQAVLVKTGTAFFFRVRIRKSKFEIRKKSDQNPKNEQPIYESGVSGLFDIRNLFRISHFELRDLKPFTSDDFDSQSGGVIAAAFFHGFFDEAFGMRRA